MQLLDDLVIILSDGFKASLSFLRVLLLLLLGLTLFASLIVTIAANGVRLSLLDANFYITQLDKAGAYSYAKETVINSSVEGMLKDAPFDEQQKQDLSVELKAGFSEAVPTSWVKAQADRLIRNAFAYAKSESAQLDLNVSTAELKPQLKAQARKLAPKIIEAAVRNEVAKNGSPDVAAANEYFASGGVGPGGCASIDECLQYCLAHEEECKSLNVSQEQADGTMGANATVPETGTGVVVQSDANGTAAQLASLTQGVYDGLDRQVDSSVPDTLDLDALALHQPSAELAKVREPLSTAILACNILVVICLALALVMAAASGKIKSALRYAGIPFAVAGAVACIASFIAPGMLFDLVSKNLPSAGSASQLNQIALQVARPLLSGYFDTTLVLAIVVGVLGLAMVALSFAIERNEQDAKAQLAPLLDAQ